MVFESIHIMLIIFEILLASAFFAVIIKKFLRDRRIVKENEQIKKYLPLIESYLNNKDDSILSMPTFERLKAQYLIEKELLRMLEETPIKAQQKKSMYSLFNKLGYLDYHLKNLASPNPYKRAFSAYILGVMNCTESEETLIKLLHDSDRDVQLAAVRSLGKMNSVKALKEIAELLKSGANIETERTTETFGQIDKKMESEAIELLSSDNENVRVFAVRLLSKSRTEEAKKALEGAIIEDGSLEVRAKALNSLANFKLKSATFVFKECLKDESWIIRSQAAKAIGELKIKNVEPEIFKALGDSEWWVRHNAAIALINLGKAGRLQLEKAPTSPDRFAQETAAEALQMSGACDEYIDEYLSVQKEDSIRAKELLHRLASIGVMAHIEERLEKETSQDVRIKLLQLLKQEREEEALLSSPEGVSD